jgi:small subunit ribosomal protein S6
MHKYEFAHIIVCEGKKDDEIQSVIGNVRQLIADLGGRIQKEDVWGAKELTYEIKKQNHGFYMFTIMTMEPDKMPEFEKKMSLMEGSLRYLLINLDNEPGYNHDLDLAIEKPVKTETEEEEKPAGKPLRKKIVKKVVEEEKKKEEEKVEVEVEKEVVKEKVEKIKPVEAKEEKIEVKVTKKAPEKPEKSQEEIDKLIDEKLNELL